jgi:hypothetical protein
MYIRHNSLVDAGLRLRQRRWLTKLQKQDHSCLGEEPPLDLCGPDCYFE